MSRHVLVARQDSMGDVLLAGPAVRSVASSASRVTLLCGPRGQEAARLLPGVDDVLVHHAPWIDATPEPVHRTAVDRFVDELALRRIDQAIVLTSFHQSPLPLALLLRMAGVPTIAAVSVDYPGALLDVRHHVSDDVHEVQRSLSLVATLGYTLPPGDDGRLRVQWPRTTRLRLPAVPYVVVHPGTSVAARAWARERCAELVRALAAGGRQVVVTGGPGEQALTRAVAGGDAALALDLGGKLDLAELAAVMARAEAVVVGNTGPAHLAAAVGTPVVSLFAPTLPAVRWRPWKVPQVLLGDQGAACAGTRATVCREPGHPCLNTVTVQEVLAAVELLAPRPALVGESPIGNHLLGNHLLRCFNGGVGDKSHVDEAVP